MDIRSHHGPLIGSKWNITSFAIGETLCDNISFSLVGRAGNMGYIYSKQKCLCYADHGKGACSVPLPPKLLSFTLENMLANI